MKLLLLADKESPYFWDYYQPGRLREYDLMLSCGDLKAEYLSFLATLGRAPLYYVRGNHDGNYDRRPPEGCASPGLAAAACTQAERTSIPSVR